MNYTLTTPCADCPFLAKFKQAFSRARLEEMASGEFHCHKTGACDEESGDFTATPDSLHCAGALIYLEKRDRSHQMMRISERLGLYDRRTLVMDAPVR